MTVENRYAADKASAFTTDLAQLVYVSRLLGSDQSLVLFGGGNTSVKVTETDLYGEPEARIYVKGSGHDLATIREEGFAPLRLIETGRLAELPALSDAEMVDALASYKIRAAAPAPSVEAVLHAALPGKFVLHTHADAVVTITNTPSGERFIREIYGEHALIVPYVMPGFTLARTVVELWRAHATDSTDVVVLMNHGVFTWGDTAKDAYDRMISVVQQAEQFLADHGAYEWPYSSSDPLIDRVLLQADLRKRISQAAGAPMLLTYYPSSKGFGLMKLDNAAELATRGPLTPDHVIRTKRVPLIGRDVEQYVTAYRDYFDAHSEDSGRTLEMLDPAPRVVLDPELGMMSAGRTMAEAELAGRIASQTIVAIVRAEALEKWQPLASQHIFDVEYWELEQAKLKSTVTRREFEGEVALVTGGASGIGKAIVDRLLELGAAVIALDIDRSVYDNVHVESPEYLGIGVDLTDSQKTREALHYAMWVFGGLDMVVLNAGIFPPSSQIADQDADVWKRAFDVNVNSNMELLKATYPLLKLAPRGGRVAVVGSKNVPAPGPGASAYSASKAALNQLARVAALEWGKDGIRVNIVHPNQVFDTALWTDEIIAARAAQYGLTVDAYRTNNVLRTDVNSRDVARVVAALLGPDFSRTTGAQVPVDGGNERVI
ncbi:MAG: bifunctional aldolase/short-chain dehydrogenase [Phototrophicaceae bacterium]|nr:3-phenylpropionate-dihydrodiol/cinnamic acid-dihydrodiol dehydrogenase [Anaerolineae bacterium]